MTTNAKDRDRALAQVRPEELTGEPYMDIYDDVGVDESGGVLSGQDPLGSKVIVIHPGSQNLRIGLASDAFPKNIPMVIAKKWDVSESEERDGEPKPKRLKLEDGSDLEPGKMFGDEVGSLHSSTRWFSNNEQFAKKFTSMSADLKLHMRNNKRKVLPNSKELVINYNRKTPPETISEHNDPLRVDWTEIPKNPKDAPAFFTGKDALRIPDNSTPRYKLFWPLQRGWYNEHDYDEKKVLFDDIAVILEEAIKQQLNLRRKKDWVQYGCVFVVPDLYERQYVTQTLEMLIRDFGFGKVCFIQESLAATFGAGYTNACVVDLGAQKSSICCVEEGMCIENSRVNLKYGGLDVTETFIKMLLFDHFPYSEMNLNRRYDFLLAEELKSKFCTMNEADISVQLFDFHLRAPGQNTRKYTFKTYDEVLLAAQGYFQPAIFDNALKLRGRRKLIQRSQDLYDGSPNDPTSAAQASIISLICPLIPPATSPPINGETNGHALPAPARQPLNLSQRFNDGDRLSASAVGSPVPDDDGTPAPAAENNVSNGPAVSNSSIRDDVLPVIGLDTAIFTSILHGARNDERKTRDLLGSIMVIGGGSQVPGFCTFLEEKLKELKPGYAKDILVGTPPRELDPQGVVWKGGSVFGKLRGTNDSWIGRMEYDRLGARLLAYKCMWAW